MCCDISLSSDAIAMSTVEVDGKLNAIVCCTPFGLEQTSLLNNVLFPVIMAPNR